MSLESGRMVTANVRLTRLLRRGGMGTVWRAEHLSLGTDVAVKFMSPQFVESDDLVERFTREATSAAQIKSPHVVQILDHGVLPEGLPFIVMELLVGEDLGQRIKRLGPLPLTAVASVVLQVGKALSKAHQAGILHRDIKPDNIFLTEEDDGDLFVKVLDFGVAKVLEDGSTMTTTGSTVGTPLYMSPEQLLSAKHVDFQCDLWSLAVVAYRATTGHLPFTGDTLGALALKVHAAKFLPASAHRPEVPPALDAWFLKALQRDPAARFGSLKELVQSLSRAIADPSVTELPSFPTLTPSEARAALAPLGGPASGIGAATVAPAGSGSLKVAAAVAASIALLLLGAVITLLLTRPRATPATIASRVSPSIAASTVVSATPPEPPLSPVVAEVSTASVPVVADSIEPEPVPPVSSAAASATVRPAPPSSARTPQIKASLPPTHPKDRGF